MSAGFSAPATKPERRAEFPVPPARSVAAAAAGRVAAAVPAGGTAGAPPAAGRPRAVRRLLLPHQLALIILAVLSTCKHTQ